MNSRVKVLLLLLGLAIVFTIWTRLSSEDGDSKSRPRGRRLAVDETVGGSTRGRGQLRTAVAVPQLAARVIEVRVADLDPRSGGFPTTRDPFTYYEPPPPPPPKPRGPTPEELARLREAEEAAKKAREEYALLHPPKPQPPPFTYAYVGSFGPARRRIAVFSDGETTFNALEGEVLANKFRLLSIGYESVDIEFIGFPDVPPAQIPVSQGGS